MKFKDLKSFYNHLIQTKREDKKWEQNRQSFLKASPTSLAVVFEQFRRAKDYKNLKSLFEMELIIAMNKTQNSDFPEGIRALLIDKSKDPKWKPGHIEDLDPLEITKYFKALKNWNCSLRA